MFFDIKDIYIGKIHFIKDFDNVGSASEYFAAFVKVYDEIKSENNYILINRGNINKNTLRFKHYTIFKTIDDIDIGWNIDFTFYYVANLKPIIDVLPAEDLRSCVTALDIHFYLSEINTFEICKTAKLRK